MPDMGTRTENATQTCIGGTTFDTINNDVMTWAPDDDLIGKTQAEIQQIAIRKEWRFIAAPSVLVYNREHKCHTRFLSLVYQADNEFIVTAYMKCEVYR